MRRPDIIMKIIELISTKEGISTLLAEGVRRASERVSRGSEKFAIHVKGLEAPIHHVRLYKSSRNILRNIK